MVKKIASLPIYTQQEMNEFETVLRFCAPTVKSPQYYRAIHALLARVIAARHKLKGGEQT